MWQSPEQVHLPFYPAKHLLRWRQDVQVAETDCNPMLVGALGTEITDTNRDILLRRCRDDQGD